MGETATDPLLLEACDATLASCDKLVIEQRDLIDKQGELIVKLNKQRNEALEMVKGEPAFPFYFWIIVGGASALIINDIRR